MPNGRTYRWLAFALAGLLALTSGCNLGWLSFNVLIPLGLDGSTGLLNPFGEGSIFVPAQNGGDTSPPLPIVIGDPSGGAGGSGGTLGGTP